MTHTHADVTAVGHLLKSLDHCWAADAFGDKPSCIVGLTHNLPDRLGAQMCRRLDAWAAAVDSNCQYSHEHLHFVPRDSHHLLTRDSALAAERFFNLGAGCAASSEFIQGTIEEVQRSRDAMSSRHALRRSHPLLLLALRERMGRVHTPQYARTREAGIIFAVHIRRGDLIHDDWTSQGRFIPDSFYWSVLPTLVRVASHALSMATLKASLIVHILCAADSQISVPLRPYVLPPLFLPTHTM